jgi:hypothetical protein
MGTKKPIKKKKKAILYKAIEDDSWGEFRKGLILISFRKSMKRRVNAVLDA